MLVLRALKAIFSLNLDHDLNLFPHISQSEIETKIKIKIKKYLLVKYGWEKRKPSMIAGLSGR